MDVSLVLEFSSSILIIVNILSYLCLNELNSSTSDDKLTNTYADKTLSFHVIATTVVYSIVLQVKV